MCLHWNYFPFPSIRDGEFHNGIIQSWPSACTECVPKHCLSPETPFNAIQQCNCGLNYIRVKEGITVGGLKISEDPGSAPLISSSTGTLHVSSENISKAVSPHNFQLNFGNPLWNSESIPAISQELILETNFIGSYRRLVNTLLQRLQEDIESPKMSLQNNYYRKIFWRCKYFGELLSSFEFIFDPAMLIKTYKCIPLKMAPLAIKQMNLIAASYSEKNLTFSFSSENSKLTTVHPDVISTLCFIIIDNAAKFAPEKSKIQILLQDSNTGTSFSVESNGPEILECESEDIYKAKYTGQASSSPGTGLGLYIASILVTTHLKSSILHNQKKLQDNTFKTTFSVDIPEKAGILY